MRVRQRAYFLVRSDDVLPAGITARLGLEPDETRRKGSRASGPPPRPRVHLWTVRSGRPDTAPLDDHFDALLTRLRPHGDRIRDLLAPGDVTGVLQVVRHFDAGAEDDDIVEPGRVAGEIERLRGQHPLLGFHLDHDLLGWAAQVHVDIDVDEYGDEYE